MYWVGQKLHSGFQYQRTVNLNELFGQPRMWVWWGQPSCSPAVPRDTALCAWAQAEQGPVLRALVTTVAPHTCFS